MLNVFGFSDERKCFRLLVDLKFLMDAVNSEEASCEKYEEGFVFTVYSGPPILLRNNHSWLLGLWIKCIRIPTRKLYWA